MKIGLLAYSTNTGLGYQTLDFYEYIKPFKVLVADLSKFNGMETHHDRYPGARICDGIPTNNDVEWLVDGCDIVFVCETPLNYYLYEYATKKGVKTVQQYNYEFLEYFTNPKLPKPTVLASPSMWGIDRVRSMNLCDVTYWPVPVNSRLHQPRTFDKVKTFVHIIGRPTACDRNGTIPFLKAAKLLGNKYRYKLYLQEPKEQRNIEHFRPVWEEINRCLADGLNIEIVMDCPVNADMYSAGEILVLPRKYGGLCLPMWEALAAGMPVIMTNISPNPTNLPINWLVESKLVGTLHTRTEILLYEAITKDLASTMARVSRDIVENNLLAREIASKMSWDMQKSHYMNKFESLVTFC